MNEGKPRAAMVGDPGRRAMRYGWPAGVFLHLCILAAAGFIAIPFRARRADR